MLPVVSSSRAQDNTSWAPSKTARGCGVPASSTANRSRVRLGRGFQRLSKMLAYTWTRRDSTRKMGSDGGAPAAVETVALDVADGVVRNKPEAPFKEAKQAVDLTQAEVIVAVGRGIKEQKNIALAQQLADALGGEIAASRPICDAGWLPMERQVGSSGQTVAPKLYLALGISGAIQHVVGMKGARTIIAVN